MSEEINAKHNICFQVLDQIKKNLSDVRKNELQQGIIEAIIKRKTSVQILWLNMRNND